MKNFQKTFFIVLILWFITAMLSAQQVFIYPCKADTVFDPIHLLKSSFVYVEYSDKSNEIIGNDGSQWIFTIEELNSYYFIGQGKNNTILKEDVWISPNDSVGYTVKKGNNIGGYTRYYLEFSGKNAAHYNYERLKREALPFDTALIYKKGMDVVVYKQRCQQRMIDELNFLENYRQEQTISPVFYKAMRTSIQNNYASELYQIMRIIPIASFPSNYFSDVELVADLHSAAYLSSLKNKFLWGVEAYPWKNPLRIYQNIINEAPVASKNFLLTNYVAYCLAMGGHSEIDVKTLLGDLKRDVKDSLLIPHIESLEQITAKTGVQLPDSVLNQTYLYSLDENKSKSLKTVLDEYSGKALFIDFWASWCGACRNNIRNSEQARTYLKNNDIEMLYISLDKDAKKWEQAISSDLIVGKHYCCEMGFESALCKYLSIMSIPHYVLLDKNHNLYLINAPRPDTSNTIEMTRFKQVIDRMN